jgi:hypothetical protein
MLSSVHPQKDGSILLHVSMGNPRHRYHDRLALYVRPGTVVRWRKA